MEKSRQSFAYRMLSSFPSWHRTQHRLKRAFLASDFGAQPLLRASRIRPQPILLAKRHIHQRVIDKRNRILDGRFEIVQKVIEVVRTGQRGKQREQRDPKRKKRVQQQWGSCCRMQFGGGSSITIINFAPLFFHLDLPWAKLNPSPPSLFSKPSIP
jgi:hypothetical protein